MKYLIILIVVALASCKSESECDKKLRRLVELDKQEQALRKKPEFNDGKDMALARIALQKAVAQRQYNACVNGE